VGVAAGRERGLRGWLHVQRYAPPPPAAAATRPLFLKLLVPPSPGSNEHVERAIKEDELAAGCTRGTLQGFWRFTPLAANVCRATLVFQATAGGSVPVLAMNFGVKTALAFADLLRDKYERNGKAVDAELRRALPPPPPMDALNEEQLRIVQRLSALGTGSVAVEWSPLKSTTPFVLLSMKHTKPERNQRR
jgi:hypothetical protein